MGQICKYVFKTYLYMKKKRLKPSRLCSCFCSDKSVMLSRLRKFIDFTNDYLNRYRGLINRDYRDRLLEDIDMANFLINHLTYGFKSKG